jgi:hypothetical protein
MTINIFLEDKDEHFDVKYNAQDYIFCDQCSWNCFPNEKIVRVFHGLRPEDEDGFIYRFTEYDYDPSGKSKIEHVHKYDQKIIDEHVRIALENQKGDYDVKRF